MLTEFIEHLNAHDHECDCLTSDQISERAADWAKSIRTQVANKVASPDLFPREQQPTSVFMAGTPGAGKTEWRKDFFRQIETPMVHIDPDEFRCLLPCYTGNNSHLFQNAVTRITERVLDRAFERCVSFVLDGTFSSVAVAKRNLKRSLERNRLVQVFFIHQDPRHSWRFVNAREVVEGRGITPEAFIKSYFGCKEVIESILADPDFSEAIENRRLAVDVFQKDIDRSKPPQWRPRVDVAAFRGITRPHYTEAELREIIQGTSS